MDIHKPRAARNWREFLVEIGTIICGILIALSLEQGVDWLHRRHTAQEERETLRAVTQTNLNWVSHALSTDACVTTRITQVQNLLLGWRPGAKLPSPLWIGRPLTPILDLQAYDSAASTGRIALLSPDEQARYGTLQMFFHTLREDEILERTLWARLRVLEVDPPYNPTLQAELLLTLQEAKSMHGRMVSGTRQALKIAQPLQIAPDPHFHPMVAAGVTTPACVPLNTPRDQALKIFYGTSDRTSEL